MDLLDYSKLAQKVFENRNHLGKNTKGIKK